MELPDHLPLSPISSARPRRHDSICSGRRHCRSFSDWGRRPPRLSPELAPSPSPTIGDSRLNSREGATCPALGPLPLPYLAIQLGDATLRPLPPPPFWTPVTTTPAQRPQATLRKVNFWLLLRICCFEFLVERYILIGCLHMKEQECFMLFLTNFYYFIRYCSILHKQGFKMHWSMLSFCI